MALRRYPRTPMEARAVGVVTLLVGAALFGAGHPVALAVGLFAIVTGLVALRHATFLSGGRD